MTKPKVDLLDLADLDPAVACAKGFELELVHPVSERGLGVFITVQGSESQAYQRVYRERVDEMLNRSAKGKAKPDTPEQIEKKGAALLAEVTTGWRGVVLGGEELPFTPANARKLYEEQRWVRQQVDRAVHDLGNFMKD